MPNTKDISVKDIRLNVLVYGKSGTGKTTLGCCFPKAYVFDFDKGLLSQRGRDVDYDTYKGLTAYQDFEMKLKELEGNCPYETLVVDSLTTMQEYLMDKILMANHKKMPTMHEWNVMIAELKDLFSRMTKMAPHTIITAHEELKQDEITGEIVIQPLCVGKKLPPMLPMWFDEVYRAQVGRGKDGKPEFALLTSSDVKYTARTRLGVLDAVEVWSKDGKMVNVFDLIMGKVEASGKA